MPTIVAKGYTIDITAELEMSEEDKRDIVKVENVYLFDANRLPALSKASLDYLYTKIEFSERFYADEETEEIGQRRAELYHQFGDPGIGLECFRDESELADAVDIMECPYHTDDENDPSCDPAIGPYDDVYDWIRERVCGNQLV